MQALYAACHGRILSVNGRFDTSGDGNETERRRERSWPRRSCTAPSRPVSRGVALPPQPIQYLTPKVYHACKRVFSYQSVTRDWTGEMPRSLAALSSQKQYRRTFWASSDRPLFRYTRCFDAVSMRSAASGSSCRHAPGRPANAPAGACSPCATAPPASSLVRRHRPRRPGAPRRCCRAAGQQRHPIRGGLRARRSGPESGRIVIHGGSRRVDDGSDGTVPVWQSDMRLGARFRPAGTRTSMRRAQGTVAG